MRIARRFNAGTKFRVALVPKGRLNVPHVVRQFVKDQAEHHRKMSFQEEFLALLRKHRIEYDERYLWD